MTIDETIRHCREVAEELKGELSEPTFVGNEAKQCEECIEEHLQLAEWLEELKELREWRTPKQPIENEQKGRWTCPNCAEVVAEYYKGVPKHYCPNCGQRLKWEEQK